jgi:hypothetical protein
METVDDKGKIAFDFGQCDEIIEDVMWKQFWLFFVALFFTCLFMFLMQNFLEAPDGPYKNEVKLSIYVMKQLFVLVGVFFLFRRAVLFQSFVMDYCYKVAACQALNRMRDPNWIGDEKTRNGITEHIYHTALKIIAENPTRLLGSWEQENSESAIVRTSVPVAGTQTPGG